MIPSKILVFVALTLFYLNIAFGKEHKERFPVGVKTGGNENTVETGVTGRKRDVNEDPSLPDAVRQVRCSTFTCGPNHPGKPRCCSSYYCNDSGFCDHCHVQYCTNPGETPGGCCRGYTCNASGKCVLEYCSEEDCGHSSYDCCAGYYCNKKYRCVKYCSPNMGDCGHGGYECCTGYYCNNRKCMMVPDY